MSMKLHFLGTGGMVPTKTRNQLSTALEYEGNIFIFDCGEGAQKQIKKMKLPIGKIKKIFISHWHADHTIGLIGLIQTLSNTNNVEKIQIYGPKNSKKYFNHMLHSTIFESKIEIEVIEINPPKNKIEKIYENSQIKLECVKIDHNDVDCLAYSFVQKDKLNIDLDKLKRISPNLEKDPILARLKMGYEIKKDKITIKPEDVCYIKKGLKVVFAFDTRPCDNLNTIVYNADYFICETNHLYEKHSKKAIETYHMTSKEAAIIAKDNKVKNLIITHFSQRYNDVTPLVEEAIEIFPNTKASYDLMTINLKN